MMNEPTQPKALQEIFDRLVYLTDQAEASLHVLDHVEARVFADPRKEEVSGSSEPEFSGGLTKIHLEIDNLTHRLDTIKERAHSLDRL